MADFMERNSPWREPARGGYAAASAIGLSGIERLRRAVQGLMAVPPIGRLTGMRPIEAGIGTCTFSMPASPWLQGPQGTFSGGVGALATDAALGASVMTALGAYTGAATSQICLNFLRPAGSRSERLVARGRLIHTTPTVGLSEVHLEDGYGRLLAHGTSRLFLSRIDPHKAAHAESLPEEAPPEGPFSTPDPWARPVEGHIRPPGSWRETSGLEWLRAGITGEQDPPPITLLTGSRPVEAEEGMAVFAMPAHEWLCSPERRVYGGATAMLAHDAMAAAIHTITPTGSAFATLDLTVNFVRPVPADGRDLRARGTVQHKGRTFVVASGEVINGDGKVVCTGTSSAMILSGRGFPGEES